MRRLRRRSVGLGRRRRSKSGLSSRRGLFGSNVRLFISRSVWLMMSVKRLSVIGDLEMLIRRGSGRRSGFWK